MPQTDGVGVMIRIETRSGKVGTEPGWQLRCQKKKSGNVPGPQRLFAREGSDAIRLRIMIRWSAFMPLLISEIKYAQVGCWSRVGSRPDLDAWRGAVR